MAATEQGERVLTGLCALGNLSRGSSTSPDGAAQHSLRMADSGRTHCSRRHCPGRALRGS
jgi:hypothetical protein